VGRQYPDGFEPRAAVITRAYPDGFEPRPAPMTREYPDGFEPQVTPVHEPIVVPSSPEGVTVQATPQTVSDGFDWSDAGIGFGIAAAAAFLAAGLLIGKRRHGRLATGH
jgi:hypothetical protein